MVVAFARALGLLCTLLLANVAHAMTRITVQNQWDGGKLKHSPVNVKIKGEGVGGCDIIMTPNSTSTACDCLWGTLNYRFHVYQPGAAKNSDSNATVEVPVCSDLKGLGNCYGKDYHCVITEDKLCHCSG